MSGSLFVDLLSGTAKGLIAPGNINLNRRTVVANPDGSYSTIRSMSFEDEQGRNVLIPTVVDGKIVGDRQAIDHYYKTGEHLGIFDTSENADAYAQAVHESQATRYANPNTSLSELLYQAFQNR